MTEGENFEQQIGQLKKEIATLSASLRELGSTKEEKYKEKAKLDAALNEYIQKANELKQKKDEIDKEIKQLKVQRETFNKLVKDISIKLSAAKNKRSDSIRQQGLAPASELRKQIRKLQYVIETEALSFEREKDYMSKIKRLKVELDAAEKREESFGEYKNLHLELKQTKEQADKLHKEIQDKAKQSSELFSLLSHYSEDINKVKANRGGLQVILSSLKTQIGTMNYKLVQMLKQWSGETHKAREAQVQAKTEELRKKTEDVKEKLKQKKKLTTKDILILQSEELDKK